MKRLFDIFCSFFGLLVLSPLFIVVGLLILLDDGGPIFFKQERVGKDGKIFKLYKFRSMRNSAPNNNKNFEPGDSSRITSIGRFIRKTKIDELPQMINVLKGDMSFVGPRPEVPEWTKVYKERWEKVHRIRPGITDNASIEFRNEEYLLAQSPDPEATYLEEILPRKLTLYEEYVQDHNIAKDILLIIRSLNIMLNNR